MAAPAAVVKLYDVCGTVVVASPIIARAGATAICVGA